MDKVEALVEDVERKIRKFEDCITQWDNEYRPEYVKDIARNKAKKDLEKFKIPVQITEIKGNIWESMFQKISEIKAIEKDKDIIINTATGDRVITCVVNSAAFVNGLKAMSV